MPNNDIYTFQLGAFTCTVFHDENSTMAGSRFFNSVPETEWKRAVEKGGYDPEAIELSYNVLLVDTGKQKILIDAGNGVQHDGRLLPIMEGAGIGTDEIDLVVVTHAHADHYGGLLNREGGKTFPKARYVMWRDEWDYYTSAEGIDHERSRPSGEERVRLITDYLLPLKPYMTFVDKQKPQIAPGIRAIPAFGHSKYHIVVEIESRGAYLLCTSDAFVHPLNLQNPHWAFPNDSDVKQTASTRRRLLEYVLVKNAQTHSYHFAFPGLGSADRDGDGYYCWTATAQAQAE